MGRSGETPVFAPAHAESPTNLTHHTERYPTGKFKSSWSTATLPDGRVVLEGLERFFYPSGRPMWTVNFHNGEKTGEERYQREDGTLIWLKTWNADGTWTWQTYNATGKLTAASHWRNKTLLGSDVPDTTSDKRPNSDNLPEPDGL